MFDRQKAFDTALNGLRKQGRRSMNGWQCAYRGVGGLKCAVGFLIPDDKYSPIVEGFTANRVTHLVGGGADDGEFLIDMQDRLHDYQPDNLSNLEDEAQAFAACWGLQCVAPEASA